MVKRLSALLAAFLAAVLCHSATLSEIRTSVRLNARDTATDSAFQRYSDAQLTVLINEAQREITNSVWVLQTTYSYTSTASQMFDDMPINFLAPIKVGYLKAGSTARTELTEKTLAGLTGQNVNWENQTGTPTNYYVRQKPDNTVKQIGLYPAPVSTSTGTVYVTYAMIPPDLSSASDVPFGGAAWLVPYHRAIVDYVTGRIKQVEGKFDEAQGYFSLYVAMVNRMRERMGEMPNYNPGMVTSGANR